MTAIIATYGKVGSSSATTSKVTSNTSKTQDLVAHTLTDDGPQRTWLRWGLVVIGAFALADASSVWWAAHGDPAEIPFGHIEGVGLSDPSVLVEQFHWSEQKLISRYVTTSALCLLLVGVCQVIGVRRAWLA